MSNKVDVWGTPIRTEKLSLFHGIWTFNVSPRFWLVDEDGTELPRSDSSTRVLTKNGVVEVSSGAVNGNHSTLRGKRHPRYQPNRGQELSSTFAFPDKTQTGGLRRAGIGTEENGCYFELDESADFYAVVLSSKNNMFTATGGQTQFDLDFDMSDMRADSGLSGTFTYKDVFVRQRDNGAHIWNNMTLTTDYTIDDTNDRITFTSGRTAGDEITVCVTYELSKQNLNEWVENQEINLNMLNLYDIQMQWRGAGEISFYVNQKLAHTTEFLGLLDTVSFPNPAMPFRTTSNCVSGSFDFKVLSGCVDITSQGGMRHGNEYQSVANSDDITGISNNNNKVLMVIYIPEYFKGLHNTRDVELLRITGWSDSKCFLNIYYSRAPTFSRAVSMTHVDDDSALHYDANASDDMTWTPSSGKLLTRTRIKTDEWFVLGKPSENINFMLTHGDYIIVTGERESAGNAQMGCSIEMGEEI